MPRTAPNMYITSKQMPQSTPLEYRQVVKVCLREKSDHGVASWLPLVFVAQALLRVRQMPDLQQ